MEHMYFPVGLQITSFRFSSHLCSRLGGAEDDADMIPEWTSILRPYSRGPEDDDHMQTMKICAIRETFEESGLLLSVDANGTFDTWNKLSAEKREEWRKKVMSDMPPFLLFCLYRHSTDIPSLCSYPEHGYIPSFVHIRSTDVFHSISLFIFGARERNVTVMLIHSSHLAPNTYRLIPPYPKFQLSRFSQTPRPSSPSTANTPSSR